MAEEGMELNTVELAADLTAAWLSNPNTRATTDDVPAFLKSMHEAIQGLTAGASASTQAQEDQVPEYTPAVTARKSLADPDFIVSLIDGKKYKSLKRHLGTHGLTPDEYRARYGLKSDYPMVAPNYAQARREMAKKIGLGRKPGQKVAASTKPKATKKSPAEARKAAQVHLGSNEKA